MRAPARLRLPLRVVPRPPRRMRVRRGRRARVRQASLPAPARVRRGLRAAPRPRAALLLPVRDEQRAMRGVNPRPRRHPRRNTEAPEPRGLPRRRPPLRARSSGPSTSPTGLLTSVARGSSDRSRTCPRSEGLSPPPRLTLTFAPRARLETRSDQVGRFAQFCQPPCRFVTFDTPLGLPHGRRRRLRGAARPSSS
jgi:hypothetical protein